MWACIVVAALCFVVQTKYAANSRIAGLDSSLRDSMARQRELENLLSKRSDAATAFDVLLCAIHNSEITGEQKKTIGKHFLEEMERAGLPVDEVR
jgi:hypothetical protein